MYCQKCGQKIEDSASFCTYCGASADKIAEQDAPCPGFAVLGFFIPLVGLILYLIFENKQPQRAKSAGKGALIGFITSTIVSVILVILYISGTIALLNNISDVWNTNASTVYNSQTGETVDEMLEQYLDSMKEETTEEILEKYVDVTFGKFNIQEGQYYSKTSLEVVVKNKAELQSTYFITIEAVDESGTRLKTDSMYVDKLNPGQEIRLEAFKHVERDKIEQYEEAVFKVLEIQRYDF